MAGQSNQGAGGSAGMDYKPYVPPDQDMKELTLKAVLLGVILAIILGAANAYLGLVAGMTVAATFPAAVIAMAALRPFKGTVLEENMARTTGAVGEALAAGAIFTIPAFLISGVWTEFDFFRSTVLMLVGGLLGVLFIIIVRRTLVEDATLPFPESRACAELVKAGQGGQTGAGYVFWAMALGSVIEFFKNPNGIKLIKPYVKTVFSLGHSKITYLTGEGSVLGEVGRQGRALIESPAASGALVGVGYIIGPKLASITFSGGVFGWLFLMPLVLFMSPDAAQLVAAGKGSWVDVASAAYSAQVKPIAVGAMLVGAFWTLYKMRNNLIAGVRRSVADMKAVGETGSTVLRTDKDLPLGTVIIAIIALLIPMILIYNSFTAQLGSAIVAALVMLAAGLLFAAVAGYLVGIIGSSSNPISGLTLTTLLIAAVLMVALGVKGQPGVAAVLGVAAVVCCVAGVAGDMIQDWKVGHILGATPWRMEVGGMIGVTAAALTLVVPLALLHENVPGGIGGENLPAPQAGLMAMMSQGIVGGEMAWPLVIAGMLFSVALILIGSPSPMLIAVGMYLPFHSTAAIFVGGIIKWYLDHRAEAKQPTVKGKDLVERIGLLIASGLIAGEALTGVATAALRAANVTLPTIWYSPWLGLVVFGILAFVLIHYPLKELNASGEFGK